MRRQKIRQQAASWVVRLSTSTDAADRQSFEHWRSADVEHDIAFEQEQLVWDRLERLSALRPAQAEPDPDLIAPAPAATSSPSKRRSGATAHPWLALAASVALAFGMGGATLVSMISAPAYATAIGERRTVSLGDGTVIELNTDSKIVVRYGAHARAIRMVRGEAIFHIVKDRRPFLLQTRAARVDAQQADLSVRLSGQTERVSLSAGSALAEPLEASASSGAVALAPGSLAVLGPTGATVRTVSAEDIARSLAWRRGVIALNGETLLDAVEEFNRYSSHKIKITDPSIASFHLGGYFNIDDVVGFAEAVTRTFPVSIDLLEDGTMLLRRRSSVTFSGATSS